MKMPEIAFIDLHAQRQRLGERVNEAVLRVLDHGRYILGPEITELEQKLIQFCGAKHALTCSNGTDALALILMAKGIGPGDAVIVPTFTFAATAEVVAWLGATPIFVDVLKDTYNMDPESLKQGIQVARNLKLNPKAVMTVDLFGLPANYDSIEKICAEEGITLISDAAQSFGGTVNGRKVGTIGEATATSFFPAKPLGCYGDGGAIFTDSDELANIIKSLRVHGQGEDKYDNVRIGMNGRLDTLQAAILIEKLAIFSDEIEKRQSVAKRYNAKLKGAVQTPVIQPESRSTWAQYSFVLPEKYNRELIMNQLKQQGIPTVVYYPKPLHLQTAYANFPKSNINGLPQAEYLANHILSLPMHPYLDEQTQEHIINSFLKVLE